MDSADEKVIGKRLQEIAKNATTGGLVQARSVNFTVFDKGGQRKDTQRGIGVHRQPLRGRGELQVHLQQRASGDG